MPFGNMYSFRNQNTHRQSEKDLLEAFQKLVAIIVGLEDKTRSEMDPDFRKDTIARAFGMLRYVHRIDFPEAMAGLSLVKLGLEMGLLKSISMDKLNNLIFNIFPTHLQFKTGCPPDEINVVRAALIREVFSPTNHTNPI